MCVGSSSGNAMRGTSKTYPTLQSLLQQVSLLSDLENVDSDHEDEDDFSANERNFFDVLDAVATGENQGGQDRGSEARDNGEVALVLVHLDVPFAPCLVSGREQTPTMAQVTEGSLKKINLRIMG